MKLKYYEGGKGKGGKICLKMHLIEQKSCNLLPLLQKIPKIWKKGDSLKKGRFHTPREKVRKELKKKKVTGIKCRNKSDKKLSWGEKVAKDARFLSR